MKQIFECIPPGSVGIKICGITNPEDVALCLAAGIDALGFNFYRGSKRFLDRDSARDWLNEVPESVFRVAVTVNPTESEALEILGEPFIDALQLHGEESPEFCAALREQTGKEIIKAVRIDDGASLIFSQKYGEFPILLDAFSKSGHGGTGEAFDWNLLDNFSRTDGIILSGGLNSGNILAALRRTGVRFVDLASGSEYSARKKDQIKIKNIVAEVRKFAVLEAE